MKYTSKNTLYYRERVTGKLISCWRETSSKSTRTMRVMAKKTLANMMSKQQMHKLHTHSSKLSQAITCCTGSRCIATMHVLLQVIVPA